MLQQKILIKYRHPEIIIDVYLIWFVEEREGKQKIFVLKNVSFLFLEKKVSQLELHSNASNLFGFFSLSLFKQCSIYYRVNIFKAKVTLIVYSYLDIYFFCALKRIFRKLNTYKSDQNWKSVFILEKKEKFYLLLKFFYVFLMKCLFNINKPLSIHVSVYICKLHVILNIS